MRAKEYRLLVDALEDGILTALHRADKHADDPLTEAQRQRLAEHLEREVSNAICERFHIDESD